MSDFGDIPLGLGMELARNEAAMTCFGQLSAQEREKIISRSHCVRSKAEMKQLVAEFLLH